MAHFYATIRGGRGEASRGGSKASGIEANVASWEGSVFVRLWRENGKDMARVSLEPWHGSGASKPLYYGPVSGIE